MALTAEDHNHVLQWAHVLEQQVHRLRRSRVEAMETWQQVRASGQHTPQDNEPFHRMRGDAHFALTAAAQLFRTLKNFDGDLRLPENINESEVRTLRNALEHWDDEDGPAKRAMAALGADPTSHRWSQVNGGGRLGDLVEDEALLQWSRKVYDELLDFDPPSPWAEGQPS